MALAFRSGSTTSAGNANGGALTINKGTGVADGDVMVVALNLGEQFGTWTAPTGWQLVLAQGADPSGSNVYLYIKRASSEGASWVWTPSINNWRAGVFAAYSGATGTGPLVDVAAGAGTNTTQVAMAAMTAPAVTTNGPNRLLIFAYANQSSDDPTALSGAASNLRIAFGSVTIGDAQVATATTTTTTQPSAGVANLSYNAIHAALIADSPPPPLPPFRRRVIRLAV